MIEAYPLQWPVGYPRTSNPGKHPHFKKTKTFGQERDALLGELKRLETKDVIISCNVPTRKDGIPYADFERRSISDRGVAVYFTFKGDQKVIACDAWDSFEINLRALWKTVEDMRALARNGCSQIISQVFTGFKALPEAAKPEDWWKVLGFKNWPTKAEVVAAYRILAKMHHPDNGGDPERFVKINEAYRQGMEEGRI